MKYLNFRSMFTLLITLSIAQFSHAVRLELAEKVPDSLRYFKPNIYALDGKLIKRGAETSPVIDDDTMGIITKKNAEAGKFDEIIAPNDTMIFVMQSKIKGWRLYNGTVKGTISVFDAKAKKKIKTIGPTIGTSAISNHQALRSLSWSRRTSTAMAGIKTASA